MSDREFKRPVSFLIDRSKINPAAPSKLVPFTFDDFIVEIVWAFEKWGGGGSDSTADAEDWGGANFDASDHWGEAQIRIAAVLEAAPNEGDVIRLTIDDWTKLAEATKAGKLLGAYAPKLRIMARAIRGATAVKDSPA
jgi:hypothetical protein